MAVNKNRKEVEMARKRVPLTKIFNGNDFASAMDELKKFRQQFGEHEILYRAKIYFTFQHGEAMAYVRRPETDAEYSARLEEDRKLEEAKAERKRLRELKAKERADRVLAEQARLEEQKRLADIEAIKVLARKLGMTAEDFA